MKYLRTLFVPKSVENILKEADGTSPMKRTLGVKDLTVLGIAAIIGAGIFSTIGNAAYNGGPAVSLLFVFTAIACGFSALCYAEFASVIPISGSAYTYSYASFGELIAWIMGWVLIMEYAFGNIAVAISWSDYFSGFLGGFGLHIPEFLTTDYFSAYKHYSLSLLHINSGQELETLPYFLQRGYNAFVNAPDIFGIKCIANIPAFFIVLVITTLVYIGIQQTKRAGHIMVYIKVGILLMIIIIGALYVNPTNWSPFAPNGITGVLKGVSAVFFAFIGFDAISTTAEECKNPQKDIPRGMLYALLITTILYVLTTLVLTGLVHYSELAVGDPMSFAFERLGLTYLSGIIAFGAIIAMTGVLLVFQVGQPRIWMSMSRDKLLPKKFSGIHPKYKTPAFATLVTGVVVGIPVLFMNLSEVTDLTSIGTLFAFALICGGAIVIRTEKIKQKKKASFNLPYINSRYIFIGIWIAGIIAVFAYADLANIWSVLSETNNVIFFITFTIISIFSVRYQWTLIPVIGLLFNIYLISRLDILTWKRFALWLLIGICIYVCYKLYRHYIRRDAKNDFENDSFC